MIALKYCVFVLQLEGRECAGAKRQREMPVKTNTSLFQQINLKTENYSITNVEIFFLETY
jgi:hypothetical protein